MAPRTKSSPRLYRAPWVIPVTSPVLRNGAVVVDSGRVVEVGPYAELSARYPDIPVNSFKGVLLPSLVNCHTHLELSIYGSVSPPQEDASMCDWIRALLKKRGEEIYDSHELKSAAERVLLEQYCSGVGLILDIGNLSLGPFDSCPVEVKALLEIFGPTRKAEQAGIAVIEQLHDDTVVTGHAPYSTTPNLLKYIKKRCDNQGELFSLHLAENPDEAPLLMKGEGCFAEMLAEREAWDGTFPVSEFDNASVVLYLQALGLFNSRTICVHCVHVTPAELDVLKETGAHICLCPGSNEYLGVGTAPLARILDCGFLPALGTDSITSNPQLDMWREMALLRRINPDVSPETVLAMATLGGARAMQMEKDYGSLEAGRRASLINVEDKRYEGVQSGEQLIDLMTGCGRPGSIQWPCNEPESVTK